MRTGRRRTGLLLIVLCCLATGALWPRGAAAATQATEPATAAGGVEVDDATCLACHDGSRHLEVATEDGEKRTLKGIKNDRFERSVHGDMACVDCHTEITDIGVPHVIDSTREPDCATCHEKLWETAEEQGFGEENPRLGVVVRNIESYRDSFHARPKSRTEPKASCDDCHDSHYFDIPPQGSEERTAWHLRVPEEVCGQCHEDVLQTYEGSVHGVEVMAMKNPFAAVCTDCHTAHAITRTRRDPFQLLVTRQCGSCHQDNFETYRDTYHGQINTLGYAYTAKCFDCHGSHDILSVSNPQSKVHPNNRLETCRECHDGDEVPYATKGFLTFGPHANTHDFDRYPQLYVAAKFMHGLLLFVFTYFWAHSLLWWYREYRDRKAGKGHPHIRTDDALQGEVRQIRRFGPIWRLGHLLFAISVMVLILTGMTVFYSYTAWAPVVVDAFGGPQATGLIHRISAAIMLGIFFLHLIGVGANIARQGKRFRWFGPDSLVPNWKDFKDAWGMFKWFVNKGPKPVFDRWTYWEKFDYWAVFWGMAVIGSSGLMLAFPDVTASIFPGWVFNVVMLVHGDEAFLAAVFLFTVHFFNNHFRPDKLPPPDIVMFTGVQSLEEFKRDHWLQYQRLVERGQLEKYLVHPPSKPMTLGSKLLGLVLITCGLGLLIIVAIGFFGGYTPTPAIR
ncbi:MAG: cytochrome c3 family protein [Gammaproteobacteria bacterium]|jgi:cytochrome b subunit of formate dehydrogenase